MKKYLSLVAIALLVSLGMTAHAETGASTSVQLNAEASAKPRAITPEEKAKMEAARKEMMEKRGEWKEERGEMKADFKGQMEVKKGEWKEQTKEMRAKARGMVATNLMRRAENLAQISGRMKSRIEKIKAEGKIDTTAALALVLKADASITIAKKHAAEVKASIEANESIETIKHHAEESRTALTQAHEYLEQAIRDLKERMGNARINSEVKGNVEVKTNTQN